MALPAPVKRLTVETEGEEEEAEILEEVLGMEV